MPGLVTGQYNLSPIESIKAPKVSDIYFRTGQELNKMYYDNRMLYTQGVANPLAQVKSTDDDKVLLNDIKSDITANTQQFLDNNDWSQARRYVHDAVDNIVSNTGLQAIQEKHAAYTQYAQGLKESGWDATNQNAFLIRSKLQSEQIEYDKNTNTVLKGGWYGVDYGTPYDLDTLNKDIATVLAKVPASGNESQRVLTDPNSALVQGISTVTGDSGEEIASYFTKVKNSSEGVTPDRIANYVYSRLQNNPEYKSYLKTINQNNWTLQRWQPDKNNPKGGTLRDFQDMDLINSGMFNGTTLINALAGYNIDLADLGAIKKDGSFKLNKNLSEDTQLSIDIINETFGLDLLQILSNGSSIPLSPEQETALQRFQEGGLLNEINNYKLDYLKSSSNNGALDVDINNFYQNLLDNYYINNSIQEQVQSYTGLFSWQKTSTLYDLVENKFAKEVYKQRKAEEEALLNGNFGPISLDTIQAVVPNVNDIVGGIENRNLQYDNIARLRNQLNSTTFTDEDYKTLGVDVGNTFALINADIDALNLPQTAETLDLLNKISTYKATQYALQVAQGNLRGNEQFVERVFDLWEQDSSKYSGLGYYGIADVNAHFILDTKSLTHEDYLREYSKLEHSGRDSQSGTTYYKSPTTGKTYGAGPLGLKSKPLSEQEYNKVLANAIDNAYNRYQKSLPPNEANQFAAVQYRIHNPSVESQIVINNAKNSIQAGVGDWVISSTPTGKGVGEPATNYSQILTIDNRDVTYSTGPNGERVNQKSLPAQNREGITNKKILGDKKTEVHYSEYNLVQDPNGLNRNNSKIQVVVSQYGKGGEFLGNIVLERQSTPEEVGRIVQSNYNKAANAIGRYGTYDVSGEISLGKIAGSATESLYSFTPVSSSQDISNNTLSANSLVDLQTVLDGLSPGESRNVKMNTLGLVSGRQLSGFDKNLKVTRTSNPQTGQLGYNVQVIGTPQDNVFGFDGLSQYVSPYIATGNNYVFNNISEAFTDLTNYIMYNTYILEKSLNPNRK